MSREHYNLDAEQDLLGTVISANDVLDEIVPLLASADDFSTHANKRIWSACISLRSKGELIGVHSVASELNWHCKDVRADYLVSLLGRAGDMTDAKACAKVIRRHAVARAILKAINEMQADVDGGGESEELLEAVERRIFAIRDAAGQTRDVFTHSAVLEESKTLLRKRVQIAREGKLDGVSYGLIDLDKFTAGMHAGELVVIGARPGVGKTIFGCHLADVAGAAGLPALFVSLEQARHELALRLLAKHSRINAFKMRAGTLSEWDLLTISEAADRVKDFPIYWDDAPNQTVIKIAAQARRLRAKKNLQLVVVDYMQLIEANDRKLRRHEQVGEMSRGLKLLARELQIPIVAMAQVNRESEQSGGEPKLIHLREAGGIEQDADTVLLMHPVSQEPDMNFAELKIKIAKQRHGPITNVTILHNKAHYALENYAGIA